MKRLVSVCQLFWPWLEKLTAQERLELERRRAMDEARVTALDLRVEAGIALEEARRLADGEAERRRGTDQKAATYLPLVAALIPLILTVVGALWDKKAGSAPVWLNMLLLGLAVAYTAAAGSWAFRELQVTVSHEAGLGDFEHAWGTRHPARFLAQRLLLHTRRNQDGINWKVSCIKMAHAFLLRAFLTFSALLMINIAWYLIGSLNGSTSIDDGRTLRTPLQALQVVGAADRLAERARVVGAWVALDEDCRRRGRGALKIVAGDSFATVDAPGPLKPEPGERFSSRRIALVCGGRTVGSVRIWTRSLSEHPSPTALGDGLPDAGVPLNILRVARAWPPKGARTPATSLPRILLRQVASIGVGDRRAIALLVTWIYPQAVMQR